MNKKLFISLAPLLASAAFAVTPAAAAPHWFEETIPVTAAGTLVASLGTLHLKSPAGEVSCVAVELGKVANPGGVTGAAGTGTIYSLTAVGCTSPTCTGVETVEGKDPNQTGHTWTSELEGVSPNIRSRLFGVDVVVKCTSPASEAPFISEPLSQELAVAKGEPNIPIGTDTPLAIDGGRPKSIPGLLDWTGSSGELCVPTESVTVCGKVTGHQKLFGVLNLELIGTGETAEGN